MTHFHTPKKTKVAVAIPVMKTAASGSVSFIERTVKNKSFAPNNGVGKETLKKYIPNFKKDTPQTELTHRARKQAKKRFKRQGNTPRGMHLTFRSWSSIADSSSISPNVVRNLAMIEETSMTLYNRKYDNLREGEKTRLFEFLKDNVIKEAKKQVIH